jgi:hypothetical protein
MNRALQGVVNASGRLEVGLGGLSFQTEAMTKIRILNHTGRNSLKFNAFSKLPHFLPY